MPLTNAECLAMDVFQNKNVGAYPTLRMGRLRVISTRAARRKASAKLARKMQR
ncbi:hypothetical protein HDG33_007351 [Paraburkholderia sp. Cpub6]|nr:hypothetical protein [Paraburkholderia sp. Cpub6]